MTQTTVRRKFPGATLLHCHAYAMLMLTRDRPLGFPPAGASTRTSACQNCGLSLPSGRCPAYGKIGLQYKLLSMFLF